VVFRRGGDGRGNAIDDRLIAQEVLAEALARLVAGGLGAFDMGP
jgi:hypothetical protein